MKKSPIRLAMSAMTLAASLVAVTPAHSAAQTVPFAGYTSGCFGVGCVPPTSNTFHTAVLGGLTYQNATFNGTTFDGFAGIGDDATPLGTEDLDNLGAFYLTSQAYNYTGKSFTLAVFFSLPGTASPSYTATLHGSVKPKQGGVFIDFDNTPQDFLYNNGTTFGDFSLEVNDVSITAPPAGQRRSIAVTGNLTATEQAVAPEPASFGLLATGLVGFGAFLRRRHTRVSLAVMKPASV